MVSIRTAEMIYFVTVIIFVRVLATLVALDGLLLCCFLVTNSCIFCYVMIFIVCSFPFFLFYLIFVSSFLLLSLCVVLYSLLYRSLPFSLVLLLSFVRFLFYFILFYLFMWWVTRSHRARRGGGGGQFFLPRTHLFQLPLKPHIHTFFFTVAVYRAAKVS